MSDDKNRQDEEEEKQRIHRSDSKWWALGLFYYNQDDRAIFVQRRLGIGVSLNYGHKAVQISAIIIAATVIILVFLDWFIL